MTQVAQGDGFDLTDPFAAQVELLGDFSWAMVALLAAVLIGWKLFKK